MLGRNTFLSRQSTALEGKVNCIPQSLETNVASIPPGASTVHLQYLSPLPRAAPIDPHSPVVVFVLKVSYYFIYNHQLS